MELAQIEHVVAVVDHGGFTRAAAALQLAQPSLSQSVRRLEDELGVTLFRRAGRTVEPTDAGRDFVGPARAVLRRLALLRTAVTRHRELATGVLHLATMPTLAANPLAPLIGVFRHRHPGVAVRVADAQVPRQLLDMVADGRCELAFTDATPRRPGLARTELAAQELFAVQPPGSPRAGEPLTLAELSGRPLVLGPPGTSAREQVLTALEVHGLGADIAVEIPQREAVLPLVVAGAGATVLPGAATAEAAQQGAVVRPLAPPLTRRVTVVHRDRELSPAALTFLALVRELRDAGRLRV